MTRDQDLERNLTDWLEAGPVTAPDHVVDEAIARTRTRGQRRSWLAWLHETNDRPRGDAVPRRLGLVAVLALTLLAAIVVAVPFAGGPGPAPEMDLTAVRQVSGQMEISQETVSAGLTERVLRVDSPDQRVDGDARQILHIEVTTDLSRYSGVMRLTNDWGTWEGAIHGARYPDGTTFEHGWLTGHGAYEGFSYFHSTHGSSAEAERVVEGAIWPGEPPPMPDPSLLP